MSFYNAPKVTEPRVTAAENAPTDVEPIEPEVAEHHSSFWQKLGHVAKAVGSALPGVGGVVRSLGTDAPNLDDIYSNQMEMLKLQADMQAMSQTFSTQSNALKADHDARMNTIRNFH